MPALDPGTRLGPYEILAAIGAGGMGEVYRAKDTRLGRDVAIKVLPHHLSAQPEVRARFEREAKTVSSLNHPNICTLFDVGRAPGEAGSSDTDYLVMELIEGETLAEKLRRGPLTTAELLRFGTQIADALDRAHRAGVVHRDLKPGNVMITRSGAKLMDFGLSRATGMAGTASGSGHTLSALSQSPTIAQALTAEGTLLGTFQYMSPEQLEGREADARSDIWALGCVLYEMATGRRAFEGRSQASLIAAILERQPPPVAEASSGAGPGSGASVSPAGFDRLVQNCLAKDPEERIQTAHDVKLQLQGIAEGAGMSATSVASAQVAADVAAVRARRGSSRLAWALAAAGLLVAGLALAWANLHAPTPSPAVRFHIGGILGATDAYWPRLSPDGRYLVLIGSDSLGVARAYVRPLGQIEAVPIPGTEGLGRPYWSPDGREIVFVASDRIERAPLAGGSPVVICAAQGGVDLSWGSKGMILMDGRATDSLRVVPASGGIPQPATRVDRAAGEFGSAWPCFLPDGQHFLFIGISGSVDGGTIRLGRLGSLDSKALGRSDGRVEYAPGGWVLFLRGSTLLAQKLDLGAAKLTGQPITLADDVRTGSSSGHFSVSQNGVLAFALASGGDDMTLREADRSGVSRGPVLASGQLRNPRISSDGHRLLYQINPVRAAAGGEIRVHDLERGTDTPLTSSGGTASTAQWAPDGRRIAYVTRPPGGASTFHVGSADGLGARDTLALRSIPGASLTQWSPDGARLIFHSGDFRSYSVSIEGASREIRPLADSTQFMGQMQVSPDGRWLAYTTGSLPNVHVFVQSLSGPPGRWQISTTPAVMGRWTRGGRELVFEGIDGRLMAVDIDTREGFRAGTPHPLFNLPSRSFSAELSSWICDETGTRFFLLTPPPVRNTGVIEVVTGLESLVRRR